MELQKIVVTRHKSLVQWLKNEGLIDNQTEHINFANRQDIEGKHVFGILPNHLACYAALYTELQLRLPSDARSRELSLKDIQFYLVKPQTYIIKVAE